jgi:hypothetical protein
MRKNTLDTANKRNISSKSEQKGRIQRAKGALGVAKFVDKDTQTQKRFEARGSLGNPLN